MVVKNQVRSQNHRLLSWNDNFVNSTSEAALRLKSGEVDLCLTTENAVKEYDIEFISPTRTILMLWSVFGKKLTLC